MGIFDTIGHMIGSFFHPEHAYKHAEKEAGKYYGQAQGYLSPYMRQGQDQYGTLTQGIQSLLNPEQLEERFSHDYQQSPEEQRMLQRALAENQQQGIEAASQMGLMGSSAALGNIQRGAANLSDLLTMRNRRQYIEDLMGNYLKGLGLSQDIYGTGANAAGALSRNAMDQGTTMANLAYGEHAAPGQLFQNLLRIGGNIMGGSGGGMGGMGGGMYGSSNMYNPMIGGGFAGESGGAGMAGGAASLPVPFL